MRDSLMLAERCMKSNKRTPLVILFLLVITFPTNSQDFLKTQGQAIINSGGDTHHILFIEGNWLKFILAHAIL